MSLSPLRIFILREGEREVLIFVPALLLPRILIYERSHMQRYSYEMCQFISNIHGLFRKKMRSRE